MSSCDHQHDQCCDRCDLFSHAVKEIESVIEQVNLSHEESEEMKFTIEQSKKNIEAWKAHLLRSVNQDEGRIDIQRNLDNTSVLVVLDWAMKFVPRKFRESQADWFGKRGISWHISVTIRQSQSKSRQLAVKLSVAVRMDFSDPQGSKGPVTAKQQTSRTIWGQI